MRLCRQRHWFAKFRHKLVVVSRSPHIIDLTMTFLRGSMQMTLWKDKNIRAYCF